MAIEVRKQLKESSQGLIHRFSQRVQQSGVLIRARGNRFKIKPKSRQMKRKAALRREKLRKEYEKLKKLSR
ncbi:MAG: hypothetical protein CO031_01345 [Candidatus Nealsonbacteria bacterium CG_4_9_14_0_2_um_filter_37_38]|uniref:30S ribosomal protein S21 n=1 Tax=Candidatus Nealsonbacteria bacterium CG_4_10_14_0_8_um_filter_37_14 TaxID=1974684 RepID=A0A2M7R7U6_9BACT|nr:MAG: hypothetical protein COV63_01090 [Candidatus Nealsonbacteria bacterium CG11_big_fil_rev_8_21_14_0_20_37_68]PIW92319.1 MAG: hypothetical protein COZ89_00470 [Candidatus Nealsonbacteria bacterium CG_4_8_14_3_um_filter_37_23]PIY89261.1 MAG: hypothetical protein COY73_01400 [Candidatus Nealsonbacteria bacterium CG_4_10_14_0_8_um_filter_37_14]PJC51678.1 MAG: hypothetical protein CO031_01345 [Candidatus Nealsonbacteria bacterium CG_4_9_14_0_2_um_filter_37_38]